MEMLLIVCGGWAVGVGPQREHEPTMDMNVNSGNPQQLFRSSIRSDLGLLYFSIWDSRLKFGI